MKIRLDVRSEIYEKLAKQLTEYGIEISDDAELILSERNQYPDYLNCRKEDGKYSISTADIVFIESVGHDILVHTQNGEYKTYDRLWQLEKSLDPKEFIRISNSVIAAKKHIRKIKATLSSKFILTMSNGMEVDVTRSYYYIFKADLGI